jgi:hypothetical protein
MGSSSSGNTEGRTEAEGPRAESSTTVHKIGVVRRPSIDISCVDDAVDFHLMSRVRDLWPRPANPEEEDDPTEALRSALRVALTEVLTSHKVSVVER